MIFTCEAGTTLGLKSRGNISHKGRSVSVDDIVGRLDAVRACYISGQGSRGVENELCDVGEGQRANSILDVSKGLSNAIGIATEKKKLSLLLHETERCVTHSLRQTTLRTVG